jgi:hypothetical protein
LSSRHRVGSSSFCAAARGGAYTEWTIKTGLGFEKSYFQARFLIASHAGFV